MLIIYLTDLFIVRWMTVKTYSTDYIQKCPDNNLKQPMNDLRPLDEKKFN